MEHHSIGSYYSVGQVWKESELHSESVKLFLPDVLHPPHYLPPNRIAIREKVLEKEGRARARENYLVQREVMEETINRKAFGMVIPKLRLNAVEQSIEKCLLKPFETPEAMQNLLARAKAIEQRRRQAANKGVPIKEPMTARSLDSSKTFSVQHAVKRIQAQSRKKVAESKKMESILTELDMKVQKFQSEFNVQRDRTKRELEKKIKWTQIMIILKFTEIARSRVDAIRQNKLVNGRTYIAAIILQRFWRDKVLIRKGLPPIRRSRAARVSLHPSSFFNGLENLRAFIAEKGSNLGMRANACTIITSFLKAATYCFKGYVKKYIINIVRLQRIIRRHQAVNMDRLSTLILLFDRSIPPLLGHIKIVASGRSLASKDLSEAELNAITRMCARISNDSLKIVGEMNTASFHSILMKKYAFEMKKHGKIARSKGSNIDLQVKKRILLNYLYKSRRISVKKTFENEFRVHIPTVSLEEVRQFVHEQISDPLVKNISFMLTIQDLVHASKFDGNTKRLRASTTFYSMVFSVTADIMAELYFECRDYERELEYEKMRQNKRYSMGDDYFDNLDDDEVDKDGNGSNTSFHNEPAISVQTTPRRSSRQGSRGNLPSAELGSRKLSTISTKARQLLTLEGSGDDNLAQNSRILVVDISGDNNVKISKFDPKPPPAAMKSSSTRQYPPRKLSSRDLI